jgi:leader peptidase (prepilin peptidase)/N-methyltransferase
MILPLTLICLSLSLATLTKLAIIDLRTLLLPNKYVGIFFIIGVIFHGFATNFSIVSPSDAIAGCIAGGGLLLLVRYFANRHYKRDTLGLGDVKVMAAAGFWLGLSDIFLAISLGALFGLLHGVIYKFFMQHKTKETIPLKGMVIPAGPGFILGIIIIGIFKFYTLFV